MGVRRLFVAAVIAACAAIAVSARADAADDARTAFNHGLDLVRSAQWAEALASFERASELRPHPVTTYNIAACERALGRYTRARRSFQKALAEHDQSGGTALPGSLAADARGYLAEIDRLLVRFTLEVEPSSALTVDGRPLEVVRDGAATTTYVAGLRAPGVGDASPSGSFVVLLDPGAHVFIFSRPGFADAILRRSFDAGHATGERVSLTQLPGTLRISSNRDGAIVRVGRSDVGPAPVDVLRPAGKYEVVVQRDGFVPYEAQVSLRAGQEANIRATLAEDKPSVLKRWWFWTAAIVVVGGAAVATYAATRPQHREEVGGGSLGWSASVP